MKPMIVTILTGILLTALPSFGHEGHDAPGALPTAPHGGKVKEAMARAGKKSASELFFEVVQEGKKLIVYPIVLTEDGKDFVPAPKTEVGKIAARVKFSKGEKKVDLKPGASSSEGTFDPQGLNWFDVLVSASHKGEAKEAKIHFELN